MNACTKVQNSPLPCLNAPELLVLEDEEKHLIQLRSALFKHFFLEEAKTSVQLPGLTSCESGFQSLLYRNEDIEKSNVVYVDIFSLPADSVLQVLSKVYSKFVGELRHWWVIIIGDAKTLILTFCKL